MRSLLVLLLPVALGAAVADVREDFEAESVSRLWWRPSGPQPDRAITTREVPAFHGERSLRVEVRPGDNPMTGRSGNRTERFELTLQRPQVNFGVDVWYAFALRVPADFPRAETRTMVHQFKENVRPRPAGLPPGVKHCEKASPVFALYLRGGRMLEARVASSTDCDHTRHVLGERALTLDRWHEIVVHTRPAHDATGRLEVWVDGELLGRHEGIMGYVCHGLGVIDTQPRFGIYRDAHPAAGAAALFFDALRFSPTREGLRLTP